MTVSRGNKSVERTRQTARLRQLDLLFEWQDHFMKAVLLESGSRTLEEPKAEGLICIYHRRSI